MLQLLQFKMIKALNQFISMAAFTQLYIKKQWGIICIRITINLVLPNVVLSPAAVFLRLLFITATIHEQHPDDVSVPRASCSGAKNVKFVLMVALEGRSWIKSKTDFLDFMIFQYHTVHKENSSACPHQKISSDLCWRSPERWVLATDVSQKKKK